jgi:hypothetical protein
MQNSLIAVALAMALLGCIGSAPTDGNSTATASPEVNGSGIAGTAANATADCKRTFTYCYTGETIMSQDCINGKPVKWVCEPYYVRHNRSTAGIPSQFMYLAEYACYWENRDAFNLPANYHPAAMCEGPIVKSWKESCDCAGYIDLVERSNPQRYYIKR